ncbi:hypothetical protein RLOC_00003264 [Lonchura striata]|uniref:Uncharacterized protein n=1 Tax=Lonchura striata TaxID=40157 RepID=A0A218UCW3_9PASE|nr:hypothetical protein RLOC_00003264 [Lonchura striata domestica]
MCHGGPGPGLGPHCKKSLYRRMEPRLKLSPPQTCAALIDPREPYKLTSGTWTGKMEKGCAQGPLALGWNLTTRIPYIKGWTPDRNCPHLKFVLPDRPKGSVQADIRNLDCCHRVLCFSSLWGRARISQEGLHQDDVKTQGNCPVTPSLVVAACTCRPGIQCTVKAIAKVQQLLIPKHKALPIFLLLDNSTEFFNSEAAIEFSASRVFGDKHEFPKRGCIRTKSPVLCGFVLRPRTSYRSVQLPEQEKRLLRAHNSGAADVRSEALIQPKDAGDRRLASDSSGEPECASALDCIIAKSFVSVSRREKA